jgi:hypothetical protein
LFHLLSAAFDLSAPFGAKAAREGLADQARPDHDVFGVGLLDGLSRRRFAGEPWATIL